MHAIHTTGSPEGRRALDRLFTRFQMADRDCRQQVAEILAAVRERGDEALVTYTRRFDAPHMEAVQLPISSVEMEEAYRLVDTAFLETLETAIDRIRTFHEREKEDSWLQTRPDGSIVGRLVRPVDSAGLYVPGGQGGSTPLVSSVLMNGIPAEIAGVQRRVMVTPPAADGSVNPHLLVAAREIGISEIYKAGSAWAIGALAYGTESIGAVDVIVGPGNRYVAEAKRQVAGQVRIDMIAGPSEVLIIADESADPVHVAADMLAQAEHDAEALAVVITTDASLPPRIVAELESQLTELSRAELARRALAEHGLILVAESLPEAIELANDIAAEHLELQIADPWSHLAAIRHAGAIFLGASTPEAAGDYLAGPNHVLPTMGTARFASALGVETFLKKSSIISYTPAALAADADHIRALARLEGLTAHAASVTRRLG
ncbi:histidinol dehydrogenase [Desulfofustis limnaeus]|uniref:Histidinol dehydrogenase n=1 Tax=Desulfofustis limnaeus TaxID=2740163 RepID=A0ABM7W6R6_9BACT|nr:histidinol dehydrogenase [Desulfofustis limnaeus]BDD86627.1 histidinol dehydrogenase [Desulfofustis limnaeus]